MNVYHVLVRWDQEIIYSFLVLGLSEKEALKNLELPEGSLYSSSIKFLGHGSQRTCWQLPVYNTDQYHLLAEDRAVVKIPGGVCYCGAVRKEDHWPNCPYCGLEVIK